MAWCGIIFLWTFPPKNQPENYKIFQWADILYLSMDFNENQFV